jgi:hypothetical protein
VKQTIKRKTHEPFGNASIWTLGGFFFLIQWTSSPLNYCPLKIVQANQVSRTIRFFGAGDKEDGRSMAA